MSLGKCCISGYSHTGTPVGSMQTIGGASVYVTLPTGDYDRTKAVLFLTDVFELKLENNKLLADDFAKNGFATYLPAYLNGDALDKDALNSGTFDLGAWLVNHGEAQTRPVIDKLISGLKAQGVTDFAATGYCFGGKYVSELAQSKVIKCGVLAHPSLLKVPEDLIAIKASGTPLLWNYAENDFMFGTEAQAKANEIFKGDKNYTTNFYPGTNHGFAVRGDLSNPAEKTAIEGSFKASVEFLLAHL